MKSFIRRSVVLGALALMVTAVVAPAANAAHYWSTYHWGRTANPFTVQLGDNLTSAWDGYHVVASADWSASSVLDTVIVPGHVSNPKNCTATAGMVEVCNSSYGNNGWLGIASIWLSGGHISQGTVKQNDYYFNQAQYNTPAWRQMVLCQEIGHTFGMGHQDENFNNANLNTCMDYTSNPDSNQHPNQHDYDLLVSIYGGHTDSTSTVLSGGAGPSAANGIDHSNPSTWGQLVSSSQSHSVYAKTLADGTVILTDVFWAN